MTTRHAFLAGAASAVLTACGGGGGGEPPAPTLALTAVTPASLQIDLYEGERVPNVTITGTIGGDVAQLSGKTLYVLATIPDPLFTTTPSFSLGSDKRSGTLALYGTIPPSGPRLYSNDITIRVCLDALCASEIAGSGARVPYSINVKPGLTSSVSNAALASPFGTRGTATVPLQIPAGATWRIASVTNGNPSLIAATKSPDGSDSVVVSTPELSLPGVVNTANVNIEAQTSDGHVLFASFQVTSTTAPSSTAVAFKQAPLTLEMVQGDAFGSSTRSVVLLAPGGDASRIRMLGVEYAWPAAAAAEPFKDHWFFWSSSPPTTSPTGFFASFTAHPCNGPSMCLPPGQYTATMRFEYSPAGGAPVVLTYPITMNINPS